MIFFKIVTMDTINNDLEACPICYDALSMPIVQCANGHIVCSKCMESASHQCCFCRCEILQPSRNLIAETLIKHLHINVRCKWDCGFVGTVESVYEHESGCNSREMKCNKCEWTGPCTHISSHLLSHNSIPCNVTNDGRYEVIINNNDFSNSEFLLMKATENIPDVLMTCKKFSERFCGIALQAIGNYRTDCDAEVICKTDNACVAFKCAINTYSQCDACTTMTETNVLPLIDIPFILNGQVLNFNVLIKSRTSANV